MQRFLTIGGKERPISFSTATLMNFGRHNNITFSEIQSGEYQFDILSIILLMFYSIKDGVRKNPSYSLPKTFTPETVADWVDDSDDFGQGVMLEFMEMFAESRGVNVDAQPIEIEEEEEEEGK